MSHGFADDVLQLLARSDHFVIKLHLVGHGPQIDVSASVGADIDSFAGHPANLLDRVGQPGRTRRFVVSKPPAFKHVPRAYEIGARHTMFDQKRQRLLAVFRVAIVERNARR